MSLVADEHDIAALKSRRDTLQRWFAVLCLIGALDWGLMYLASEARINVAMMLSGVVFVSICCVAIFVWAKAIATQWRIAKLRRRAASNG